MGLTVYAKGLKYENSYDCGYITFGIFRQKLAKLWNKRCGEIYEKSYISSLLGKKVTEEEWDEYNSLCNDDLDIFLFHSDCDGKFTPQECRKIYNSIKNMSLDMEGHNYGTVNKTYNMLEQWKGIFKHCSKRRVNLYFI